MLNTLFNPVGRLSRNQFLRGLILCLIAAMFIQILVSFVSPGFSVVNTALVFPFFCVFGKRLHDAGLTAWWFLAFLAGYFVLSTLLTAILLPFVSPESAAMQAELQEIGLTDGFGAMITAAMEQAPAINRASIMTTLVVLLITNGVLGLVAASLKSDPNTNKHGPPTLRSHAPNPDDYS